VLLLSQHIEATHAVDLVSGPGFGYLLKDRVLEVEDFLDTAQRIADGGSALDPKIVARLVAPQRRVPWTGCPSVNGGSWSSWRRGSPTPASRNGSSSANAPWRPTY
jgi:hypothetical protein